MIARGSIDKSSYKLRHRIYTIYNFYRPVLLHPLPPHIKKVTLFFKNIIYLMDKRTGQNKNNTQCTKDRMELRKQEETHLQ